MTFERTQNGMLHRKSANRALENILVGLISMFGQLKDQFRQETSDCGTSP